MGTPTGVPTGGPFIPAQSGHGGGGIHGTLGGPATPTRGPHGMAPSVVISPSAGGNAPVCCSLRRMVLASPNPCVLLF